MVNETRKILHNDAMRITATTVRVPVFNSHSESINVEFEKPFEMAESVIFDSQSSRAGKCLPFCCGNTVTFFQIIFTAYFYICGTTGEASTMDDASQIECVRYAKEVAAGRVPVILSATTQRFTPLSTLSSRRIRPM